MFVSVQLYREWAFRKGFVMHHHCSSKVYYQMSQVYFKRFFLYY